MLSDESSSDSETGRFKCQTNKDDDAKSHRREENTSSGRSRNIDGRYNRDFGRKRNDRDRFDRHSRERNRYSRYSPIRRRHSRDKSRERRKESDRYRSNRGSRERTRPKERSLSRDRKRKSRSGSHKSPVPRNMKDEIKNLITTTDKKTEKYERNVKKESSLSPNHVVKKSEVHKPIQEPSKRRSDSPILVEEDMNDYSHDEVQPGSYYSMIPAVIKEKSEESTEIDSSDDEKLRAKLLNLEKEFHKSKKKKHKKRHKKKSKTNKEKDDSCVSVEVTSTTDIQEDNIKQNTQSTEVSSTQKNNQKESSEEGEILSEDDQDIDPTDLRHKLKRSKNGSQENMSPKLDACGPALPPHLQKRFHKSSSPSEGNVETSKTERARNIGPSIPSDMRKVLAERSPEIIKDESSEEDTGIGPLPTGAEQKMTDAHKRLEERAYELKIKQLDGHTLHAKDTKSREQWMLELPEGKTKFLGLEARGFRAKEGPDMSDRSSWTDTPEEKARKAAGIAKEENTSEALQREAKERNISSRDEEQEQAVRKHKKKHKRDESLLEIHQKKLKKKKKKESEEKKERRPFSRDVDLQVNRFDEAQKKSIIKKAQDLNSRFSQGEAKFL
ncbi:GPALPP motifs-containing protein 1-like [Zerene cesonia]|uniref:GPALPP motifs-containing protein 1-like n=1 Tax=Zerene cesonia TaxID=33412 RepID=UPI0018E4F3FE|nr:GPALPP motifs-containing protein 1-like [Zerene cesonia]